MSPLDQWNMSKLAELGGDALEVASHAVTAWPGVRIASAARDYKQQARDMAQNACAQRDNPKTPPADRLKWIQDTYWPSIAAMALQHWFEQRPNASEPDVVDGFLHLMRGLAPNELRALSKHIVMRERDEGDGTAGLTIDDRAQAVDFDYVAGERDDALCAYLIEQAHARGGRFIPKEGKLIRRHWQAR